MAGEVSAAGARRRGAPGVPQARMETRRRPVRGIERLLRDLGVYLIRKEGRDRLGPIGQQFSVGCTRIVKSRRGAERLACAHALLIRANDNEDATRSFP